ncbi:MAG: RDD family protein [Kiloniellaceae bacterium]
MTVDDSSRRHEARPWRGQPPAPSITPQLYAGLVLRRCFAYLVDVLIVGILGLVLAFALSIVGLLSFGLLGPLAVIALALWPLAYHSYFIARRGATPGMRLLDVELRDWSGKAVEPAQAILVVLLFYVSIALTAWLILLVVLFTDRGRALHDILAGTVVVRRRT